MPAKVKNTAVMKKNNLFVKRKKSPAVILQETLDRYVLIN